MSNKNKKSTIEKTADSEDKELFDNLSSAPSLLKEEISEKKEKSSKIIIPKSKAVLIKKLFDNIRESSQKLADLFSSLIPGEDEAGISLSQLSDEKLGKEKEEEGESRVIEGVFDGENMIGPDGKQYTVPANYASKSKLVEGDILKLTITDRGTFIYKQISPIERIRVIGRLEKASDGIFYAVAQDRKWRVLTASVTYFKGEPGDEIVILIPQTGESKWAAVENIIRKMGVGS